MAGKISKQKAIELILVELDKGSTYSDCLNLIGPKWSLSTTTFKRYWKEANQTYTGKIVKVTPRLGYTPRELCNKCPAPYTDQPILGMDILKGLQQVKNSNNYEKGRVIDPLAGRIYDAKIRLNSTGKRLTLRAYMGVSTLGRSQTWIRIQ